MNGILRKSSWLLGYNNNNNNALITPYKIITRNLIRRKKVHNNDKECIRSPGGVAYYPRTHNEPEQLEIIPSKLLMITRVKAVKGRPWWERDILKSFHIDEESIGPAIVKNIPEQVSLLWKIKHLIRVTPITFPYGEPTEEDIKYTVLNDNGECIVKKELKISDECVDLKKKHLFDPKRLKRTSIDKVTRYRWLNPFNGGY